MEFEHSIEDIKSRIDILTVAENYGLHLKKQGGSYVSLCCFHEEKTPSLQFDANKQVYHCKGCGSGGDVYEFVKQWNGSTDVDTISQLKQLAGITDSDNKPSQAPIKKVIERPAPPEDDWSAVIPVPTNAPKLTNNGKTIPVLNPKTGKETEWIPDMGGVFPYRTVDDKLIGVVIRSVIDGKKLTPTLTYCVNSKTGEERWILKGFPEKRPLYNLDRFDSKLPVLVVEGEKCTNAMAMHKEVQKEYSAIGWPMGTNAVKLVDWSHLYGLDVTLWADNDLKHFERGVNVGQLKPQDEQSGRKAMLWIKKHLEANGSTVILLDQPQDMPDGWDCADGVDGSESYQYNPMKFIEDHTPVLAIAPVIDDQADDDEEYVTPEPDVKKARQVVEALGYDEGRFYYNSLETKQIKRLADKEHSQNTLLGMAPIEYWTSAFNNGKDKPDWAEATSFLMTQCRNKGIFDKKKIRGRGCWIDDNRFIFHLGDRVVVDGEEKELGDFRTNYVYQAAARKKAPCDPLTDAEAKGLIEGAKSFDWDMPASGPLLAGYCVLAPICGALDWRPHVWINGGSGSGKSTITKMFTRKLVGDMGVYLSLNSSVAGLRQTLRSDAFPVVIEEFDPKTKMAAMKAQEYFDMMRDASDDSDNPTLRGSASGDAIEYSTNSMFHLVGIQLCTDEQAVLNRTAVLSLNSRPDKTEEQKALNAENWKIVQESIDKNVTSIDNLSSRLLARTIANIDVIIENIKTFRKAAHKYFGNSRYADQYGTLLAGAYSLVSDCRITEETAFDYIKAYDWEVYTEDSDVDTSINALNEILQIEIKVPHFDRAPVTMTIIEAITSVRFSGDHFEEAKKQLANTGILCNTTIDHIVVSNSHKKLREGLKGLEFGVNWSKYLRRIKGDKGEECLPVNPKSFGGTSQRGTSIPFSIFLNTKADD